MISTGEPPTKPNKGPPGPVFAAASLPLVVPRRRMGEVIQSLVQPVNPMHHEEKLRQTHLFRKRQMSTPPPAVALANEGTFRGFEEETKPQGKPLFWGSRNKKPHQFQ